MVVTAVLAGVRIYFTATRNDRQATTSASLALLGGASVGLPAAPLAVGLSTGCSDTGPATFFTANWVAVGLLVVVWVGVLAGVYRAAGAAPQASILEPIAIATVATLGAVLEYPISESVLTVYCNDTISAALGIQLVVAFVAAACVASSAVWWMRRRA